MKDADCIVYLVDTSRNVGVEELRIAHRIKNAKAPVILALNQGFSVLTTMFIFLLSTISFKAGFQYPQL